MFFGGGEGRVFLLLKVIGKNSVGSLNIILYFYFLIIYNQLMNRRWSTEVNNADLVTYYLHYGMHDTFLTRAVSSLQIILVNIKLNF